MKLRVLGCYGGNIPGHGMTSFLINDTVALDAGWGSGALSLKEQVKVKDILISHHLPPPGFGPPISRTPEVIAAMKNPLFNNPTWPNFTSLPNDLTPVLKLI